MNIIPTFSNLPFESTGVEMLSSTIIAPIPPTTTTTTTPPPDS